MCIRDQIGRGENVVWEAFSAYWRIHIRFLSQPGLTLGWGAPPRRRGRHTAVRLRASGCTKRAHADRYGATNHGGRADARRAVVPGAGRRGAAPGSRLAQHHAVHPDSGRFRERFGPHHRRAVSPGARRPVFDVRPSVEGASPPSSIGGLPARPIRRGFPRASRGATARPALERDAFVFFLVVSFERTTGHDARRRLTGPRLHTSVSLAARGVRRMSAGLRVRVVRRAEHKPRV